MRSCISGRPELEAKAGKPNRLLASRPNSTKASRNPTIRWTARSRADQARSQPQCPSDWGPHGRGLGFDKAAASFFINSSKKKLYSIVCLTFELQCKVGPVMLEFLVGFTGIITGAEVQATMATPRVATVVGDCSSFSSFN